MSFRDQNASLMLGHQTISPVSLIPWPCFFVFFFLRKGLVELTTGTELDILLSQLPVWAGEEVQDCARGVSSTSPFPVVTKLCHPLPSSW